MHVWFGFIFDSDMSFSDQINSVSKQGRNQKEMLGGSAMGGSRLSYWRGEFEGEARVLREKPESGDKPEKKRGRGLGRGLGEPLPENFSKL